MSNQNLTTSQALSVAGIDVNQESLRIGLRYVKAEPKSLCCDQSQCEHHQEPEMGFIDIEAHRRFIENLRSLRDNKCGC